LVIKTHAKKQEERTRVIQKAMACMFISDPPEIFRKIYFIKKE
jgi:hypothetical protein